MVVGERFIMYCWLDLCLQVIDEVDGWERARGNL